MPDAFEVGVPDGGGSGLWRSGGGAEGEIENGVGGGGKGRDVDPSEKLSRGGGKELDLVTELGEAVRSGEEDIGAVGFGGGGQVRVGERDKDGEGGKGGGAGDFGVIDRNFLTTAPSAARAEPGGRAGNGGEVGNDGCGSGEGEVLRGSGPGESAGEAGELITGRSGSGDGDYGAGVEPSGSR